MWVCVRAGMCVGVCVCEHECIPLYSASMCVLRLSVCLFFCMFCFSIRLKLGRLTISRLPFGFTALREGLRREECGTECAVQIGTRFWLKL